MTVRRGLDPLMVDDSLDSWGLVTRALDTEGPHRGKEAHTNNMDRLLRFLTLKHSWVRAGL